MSRYSPAGRSMGVPVSPWGRSINPSSFRIARLQFPSYCQFPSPVTSRVPAGLGNTRAKVSPARYSASPVHGFSRAPTPRSRSRATAEISFSLLSSPHTRHHSSRKRVFFHTVSMDTGDAFTCRRSSSVRETPSFPRQGYSFSSATLGQSTYRLNSSSRPL